MSSTNNSDNDENQSSLSSENNGYPLRRTVAWNDLSEIPLETPTPKTEKEEDVTKALHQLTIQKKYNE